MDERELYFIYKTTKALKDKGLHNNPEYCERLAYELKVILKMGYSGYFLIVSDFIVWCQNHNILVGPGRGSGAGSLVCYLLDITKVDPLQYDLLFERFLNPARVSMPDIDVDVEKRYRHDVIKYLEHKYGSDKVAHIVTFKNRRAKGAVKDTARILGMPIQIGETLSDLLLPPIHGKPQKLATSIETVKELRAFLQKPESSEAIVLTNAQKLEDLIVSVGIHASGIVVSNVPLVDIVPLCLGKKGEVVCQWPMDDIEAVGLIKFDVLGLDALSKIHDCIDIIKVNRNVTLNPYELPIDDPDTFAQLRSGDVVGEFQLETSSGMKDLMMLMRPKDILDIATLLAIYRPGPLGSDYKNTYLRVRAGLAKPQYLVPQLEEILSTTSGWVVFQEQCMQIARKLCGYTMAEADDFRKAIGKKKKELMDFHEKKFKDGWIANNHGIDEASVMWETLVSFGSYGFNLSHAVVYAIITYITAYLKTHYKLEFMQAIMSSQDNDHDDLIKFISECKNIGIDVMPPDINESHGNFHSIPPSTIRFGFYAIKNIGAGADAILLERNTNGHFTSFDNFLLRMHKSLNKTKIETLILAGAFDKMGYTRASLITMMQDFLDYKEKLESFDKKWKTYQTRMDKYNERTIEVNQGTKKAMLKLPVAPESPPRPTIHAVPELDRSVIQTNEHNLLGFYITSHPLTGMPPEAYIGCLPDIDAAKHGYKRRVSIVCVISIKHEITTKQKAKMATFLVEDGSGSIELVFFPKTYEKFKHILQPAVPIVISGMVEITETEEGEAYRIKAWEASDLSTILQSEAYLYALQPKNTKIEVPISRLYEISKYIEQRIGGNDNLQLIVHSNRKTKIDMGKIQVTDIERTVAKLHDMIGTNAPDSTLEGEVDETLD